MRQPSLQATLLAHAQTKLFAALTKNWSEAKCFAIALNKVSTAARVAFHAKLVLGR
jgi:hypothetical protein